MSNQKVYEVVMPKLGLIMTEGTLSAWLKQDGEWIDKGQPLFSFESEKSVIEIESPASGFVETLVPVGETVPVQTLVALIHFESGDSTITRKAQITKAEIRNPILHVEHVPEVTYEVENVRATPKARKLARLRGIPLVSLVGTGPRSMIVTHDLETTPPPAEPVNATPIAKKMALDSGVELGSVRGTGPGGKITREDVAGAIASQGSAKTAPVQVAIRARLPLDGLRGLIAERLSASWNERPQVTLHSEVDATSLLEIRSQNCNAAGDKVSLNAFFVAACARALAEFPNVNAQLTESGLVYCDEINIGIAIDTERGLVAPVLRNAVKKSLLEIDAALQEVIERTLNGKTLPDEYSGGTFTITNLGPLGVDSFTPIINPPEAAILGIGRIQPKPVAREGRIEVRNMVTLSLSFDHRLNDGAPAARFLHRIAELVENPDGLLEGKEFGEGKQSTTQTKKD